MTLRSAPPRPAGPASRRCRGSRPAAGRPRRRRAARWRAPCRSAAAAAQPSRPVASASQVSGSVSMTLGGVPRVCRGPATHWTAANGGTRTSTDRPGARSARASSRNRVAERSASRCGSAPASTAAVTASTLARPRAAGLAGPVQGGWPRAARCSLTAASRRPGSGCRTGTPENASGPRRHPARGRPGRAGGMILVTSCERYVISQTRFRTTLPPPPGYR